jgi:hypothetical protein
MIGEFGNRIEASGTSSAKLRVNNLPRIEDWDLRYRLKRPVVAEVEARILIYGKKGETNKEYAKRKRSP